MKASQLQPRSVSHHQPHLEQSHPLTLLVIFIFYFLPYSSGNRTPVAGPTLTLWIPGQTLFASTSSYPSLVQSLPVQWSFQLIHTSLQDTQDSLFTT